MEIDPNESKPISMSKLATYTLLSMAKQNTIIGLLADLHCKGMTAEDRRKFIDQINATERANFKELWDALPKEG